MSPWFYQAGGLKSSNLFHKRGPAKMAALTLQDVHEEESTDVRKRREKGPEICGGIMR